MYRAIRTFKWDEVVYTQGECYNFKELPTGAAQYFVEDKEGKTSSPSKGSGQGKEADPKPRRGDKPKKKSKNKE